jgi:hypothetical protein
MIIAVTLGKDILSNDIWWGSLSFYKEKHALLGRNSYKVGVAIEESLADGSTQKKRRNAIG